MCLVLPTAQDIRRGTGLEDPCEAQFLLSAIIGWGQKSQLPAHALRCFRFYDNLSNEFEGSIGFDLQASS